ncbi:hypothetical protein Hanom_Chr07g00603231 [Helianthus anomalus]
MNHGLQSENTRKPMLRTEKQVRTNQSLSSIMEQIKMKATYLNSKVGILRPMSVLRPAPRFPVLTHLTCTIT